MRRQKIIFCITNVCRTYIKVCSRHRPYFFLNNCNCYFSDLNVNDGRPVLEAHLLGEQTVDRLVGARPDRDLLLLEAVELEGVDVDDAGVGADPQRVGLLLGAGDEGAHEVHVADDGGRNVVHGLELARLHLPLDGLVGRLVLVHVLHAHLRRARQLVEAREHGRVGVGGTGRWEEKMIRI